MLGVRRVAIVVLTNAFLVAAVLAAVLVVIPVIVLLVLLVVAILVATILVAAMLVAAILVATMLVTILLVAVVLLDITLVRILVLLAASLMIVSPFIIGSGSSIPGGPVTLRTVCVSMSSYSIGLSSLMELETYQTALSISTRLRGQAIPVVACGIIRPRGVCGHRHVSIFALFIQTAPIPLIPEDWMGAIIPRGVEALVTHDGAGVDDNVWNRGLGSPGSSDPTFFLAY